MRRIPTAEQKEELKQLLKKQYVDAIESIDQDEDLRPAEGDWHLSDEIEKTRCNKQIYFRHFFAKLFRHFSHDFCDSFVLVYS